MTLELLISTIDDRINGLRGKFLPIRTDVRYLISWQHTGQCPTIPDWLIHRDDIRVIRIEGKGLCLNRNNALKNATGDILKICDDDERWTDEYFDTILDAYTRQPETDIIHFQAIGPKKIYPPRFISSFEITMRRETTSALRFDERFGLGSLYLNAGEESVFIHDAMKHGLKVTYEPYPICETRPDTTGDNIRNPLLQRSKGAVFYYTDGLLYAIYKSIRESFGWMIRERMNPFQIIKNMVWGIRYIRQTVQTMHGVTIVIPIRNRAKFLPELFQSLAAVTYEDLEIILVDNKSEDNSLSMCRAFAENAPMVVRVLLEENIGASYARNRGLAECRTDWIYFFDSDDILSPSFLNEIMPQTDGADLVVFPTMQKVGGHISKRSFVQSKSPGHHILSATLNTQAMLFHTTFLRSIGGWDTHLPIWDDWELGIRALASHPNVKWLPNKPFHLIRVHDDSLTGPSFSSRRHEIEQTMQLCNKKFTDNSIRRALYLRMCIADGQVRKENDRPLKNAITANLPTRILGAILRTYTALGGRGAWRLALLFS